MTMYREYEFQFNGFNFVSSVDVMGSMYQQIKRMPESAFIKMNLDCLSELLAGVPMTIDSIQQELKKINDGGTQAFISLGKN